MPDEKLARAIRSKIRRDILHILYNNKKVVGVVAPSSLIV